MSQRVPKDSQQRPSSAAEPAVRRRPGASAPQKPRLDAVDLALLRALARDARAPGRRLAEVIGIAESTVSTRLRQLLTTGVVRGFRADIDLAALGAPLQALISVRLGSHSRTELDRFRSAVAAMPGVLSVFHIGGADDYLLHVVARDAEGLRDLVMDHLTTQPAIAHTETSLVFEHWQGSGWQELLGTTDV